MKNDKIALIWKVENIGNGLSLQLCHGLEPYRGDDKSRHVDICAEILSMHLLITRNTYCPYRMALLDPHLDIAIFDIYDTNRAAKLIKKFSESELERQVEFYRNRFPIKIDGRVECADNANINKLEHDIRDYAIRNFKRSLE